MLGAISVWVFLALGVLMGIVIVVWIIFPFIVMSKFNRIERRLIALHERATKIEGYTRSTADSAYTMAHGGTSKTASELEDKVAH